MFHKRNFFSLFFLFFFIMFANYYKIISIAIADTKCGGLLKFALILLFCSVNMPANFFFALLHLAPDKFL